jgi:hypothetical protein
VKSSGASTPKLTDQTQPFAVVPGSPGPDLQRLWFATQARSWSSLAVIPASPGGPALELAQALFDVGSRASTPALKLVDGRSVSLATSAGLIVNVMGMQQPVGGRAGSRVLVVLHSVLAEPAGIPVALSTDAVLLCIELGKTSLDEARRTVSLVGGPERVLGCIDVRPR